MVLFVIMDIVLRRFFNSPLSWSLEVVQVMLVVVVFFSVAHTGSRRGHVSVDLFISKLPAKSQTIIDCFTYILGILLFVFMGWGSYPLGDAGVRKATVSRGYCQFPIYPFTLAVAFWQFFTGLWSSLLQLFES